MTVYNENICQYEFDYFERGIETGKSCFTNYRWLPELTTSLAMSYIDYLGLTRNHKILDYGCAKGFVVKALRILYRPAWGCDISSFAINSSDNDTRKWLELCNKKIVPFDIDFDCIIAKDVFEHLEEQELDKVLRELRKKGKILFAIIPLGKDEEFVIPAYNLDITHKIAQNKDWWLKKFKQNGWKLQKFSYYVTGIKESWSNFPEGNGFFLLKR